jgi:hypothetical protein
MGELFLTRGRVCDLQFLPALASAVFLRSESRGTRDHISQSQIRDISFLRLLRLAVLRWGYSTPPPHWRGSDNRLLSLIWQGTHRKRRIQQFFYSCVCIRCRGNVFTETLPGNNSGIHIYTLRLMGGINEVRRWDRIICHDIHTKFHDDWLSHSKVDRGIYRHADTKIRWRSHNSNFVFKIRKVG